MDRINANTPIVMTAVVLIGIFVLLAMNFVQFVIPQTHGRLTLGDINGMAVEHNRSLYTLNLAQQMEVAAILNAASPTSFKTTSGQESPKNIQTLYIYGFGKNPTIEIVPLAYINDNLVFAVPVWNNSEFIEPSNGKLKALLANSYDP